MLFGIEGLEIELLKYIQQVWASEAMDIYMLGISSLANGGFFWILVAIPFLFTDKYRRTAILMLVGMLVGLLLGNVFLKNIIARPRPCWIDTSHALLLPTPTDFSCPSGHALSSFICAFMLQRKNKYLGVLAFVVAAIISFSRLYLFVHYPTDILMALLLAYAIYKLVIIIYKKFFRHLHWHLPTGKHHKNRKHSHRHSSSHRH